MLLEITSLPHIIPTANMADVQTSDTGGNMWNNTGVAFWNVT
jgi:hypothetical protein